MMNLGENYEDARPFLVEATAAAIRGRHPVFRERNVRRNRRGQFADKPGNPESPKEPRSASVGDRGRGGGFGGPSGGNPKSWNGDWTKGTTSPGTLGFTPREVSKPQLAARPRKAARPWVVTVKGESMVSHHDFKDEVEAKNFAKAARAKVPKKARGTASPGWGGPSQPGFHVPRTPGRYSSTVAAENEPDIDDEVQTDFGRGRVVDVDESGGRDEDGPWYERRVRVKIDDVDDDGEPFTDDVWVDQNEVELLPKGRGTASPGAVAEVPSLQTMMAMDLFALRQLAADRKLPPQKRREVQRVLARKERKAKRD